MKKYVIRFVMLLIIMILSFQSCERKEEALKSPAIKTESEDTKVDLPIIKNAFRESPTKKTRATYQWYCAPCHGIKGKGNGINAHEMPAKPINHTDPGIMSLKSDNDLFLAISKGGLAINRAPCMPPWEHTLDKKTIASLVGYLRELCKCEYS